MIGRRRTDPKARWAKVSTTEGTLPEKRSNAVAYLYAAADTLYRLVTENGHLGNALVPWSHCTGARADSFFGH